MVLKIFFLVQNYLKKVFLVYDCLKSGSVLP